MTDNGTAKAIETNLHGAWKACALCFAAFVLAYLDRQIISVLVEPLRADLSISDTEVSLLHGLAFSLIFAIAGYPAGAAVDRFQRRTLLVAGIVVWSLATLLCGFATNFWQLFAARVIVGIGEACLAPACASLLADYFVPAQRGRATAIVSAGAATGGGLSILIGGLVLQFAPHETVLPLIGSLKQWQLAFLLVALPGFLLAAVLLRVAEPRRQDISGAAHVSDANIWSHLSAHRAAYGFTFLSFGCAFIIAYSVAMWTPALLMRNYALAPGTIGLTLGIFLIFNGPIASSIGGWLSDRTFRRHGPSGRHRLLYLTGSMQLAFIVLLGLAASLPLTLLALAGLSFFGSMMAGSSYQIFNEITPNVLRGRVIAIYLLVANLLGLGLSPTAVALFTDFVFQDPAMVRLSLVSVNVPAACLGLLFAYLGAAGYRRAAENQGQIVAPATTSGH